MKYRNMAFILPISLLSFGCSSDDIIDLISEEKEEIQFSGKVIDGYISGAKVFIDLNGNGKLDDDEPIADEPSDENGNYSFNVEIEPGSYRVIAEGGFDEFSKTNFIGTLASVIDTDNTEDSLVISPVSTLVAEQYFSNTEAGLDDAEEVIKKRLNIDLATDIFSTDFIETKNIDLFKINQDVLLAIDTISQISAKKDSVDKSEAYTQAIDSIVATGTLDPKTNIEKLGFVHDESKSNSNLTNDMFASNFETGNGEDIDSGTSFTDLAKKYQEKIQNEREARFDSIEKNPEAFTEQQIVPAIDHFGVENIRAKISTDFEKFQNQATKENSSEFDQKVLSYVDMESKNLTVLPLKDLDISEESENEFKKVGVDLKLLNSSINNFIDSLEDDYKYVMNNIQATNISQLPETVNLENGTVLVINLANSSDGEAIIKFSISGNGANITGKFKISIDEHGDIQKESAEIIVFSMNGTLMSNGSEFNGEIRYSDEEYFLKGNYLDPANDIYFKGSFDVTFSSDTVVAIEDRIPNILSSTYSANTVTSSSFETYTTKIDSNDAEYRNNIKEDYSEYGEDVGVATTNYMNKKNFEYSSECTTKYCEDESKGLLGFFDDGEHKVIQSIQISVDELRVGDLTMSCQLQNDGGNILNITDFTLKKGDNFYLSFISGTINNDFAESFNDTYSTQEYGETDFVTDSELYQFSEDNEYYPEIAGGDSTMIFEENSNKVLGEGSSTPPSIPEIKNVNVVAVNSSSTASVAYQENEIVSNDMDYEDKMGNILITGLKLKMITETGRDVSAKGDLSITNSVSYFKGEFKIDSINVKGLIVDIETKMSSVLDVTINSDEVTNLKLSYISNRDSIQLSLEDKDGYKLLINSDRKTITAVDNQGNISNNFQIVE